MVFVGKSISGTQYIGYALSLFGLATFKPPFNAMDKARNTFRRLKTGWPNRYPVPTRILFGAFSGVAVVCIAVLLFSSAFYPSSSFSPSGLKRPFLDRAFGSSEGGMLDIVVNMYKEDPAEVGEMLARLRNTRVLKPLNARVIVYVKYQDANTTAIMRHTGASTVTVLPNIGREGGSYLHHILGQWDRLARHTLFIQGGVHELDLVVNRLEDYFIPNTGILSLGFMQTS